MYRPCNLRTFDPSAASFFAPHKQRGDERYRRNTNNPKETKNHNG